MIAPGRWRISAVLPDSRLIDGWLAMWTSDSSIENVVRERLDEQTEATAGIRNTHRCTA